MNKPTVITDNFSYEYIIEAHRYVVPHADSQTNMRVAFKSLSFEEPEMEHVDRRLCSYVP